ncbi:hypothetical protein PIB30_039386 [Stylosanthes scabra]|uniref:Tyrosine-specific transport protein n=1 Tax=Stylosanthes scabra TaxID=79078 RepID=A0ABU6YF21_9FABA|nr:hypothetical protein [Stylosanthes scabra]
MDSQCITQFGSCYLKIQRHAEANSSWAATNPPRKTRTTVSFKTTNSSYGTCLCYFVNPQLQKPSVSSSKKGSYARKAEKCSTQLSNFAEKKKGSVAGAVALIIGTSIGSGILALPQKASPAGFIPSSVSVIVCWVFLLIEALLLVEINVALMRKKGKELGEDNELEAISIRTMAQETLGVWGGSLATIAYVFLAYSSMVAYCSKSGEILFNLINIPPPVSGSLFAGLFTMLVFFGGTRATDQVNQYLTSSMIGLLLAIEVLAVVFGGWSGVGGNNDWTKVPPTIPVIIFSLVYHDIAPVLCAYLEGDLTRIRASVFLGSLIPMVSLLVWDVVALGLAAEAGQVTDPVELLYR